MPGEIMAAWGLLLSDASQTERTSNGDSCHKDPRGARAADLSMSPTTTGAVRAIGLIIPELNGEARRPGGYACQPRTCRSLT